MESLPTKADRLGGPPEKRAAPRQRALLRATLSYSDGPGAVECTVTQISALGARIQVRDDVSLPERFRIEIPQRRIERQARIVRKEAGYTAIAFEDRDEASAMTTALLLERLQALEAENRTLRANCAALIAQLEREKPNY